MTRLGDRLNKYLDQADRSRNKKFKVGDRIAIAGCPYYLMISKIDNQGNYHMKKDTDDTMAFVMTPSELNKAYV